MLKINTGNCEIVYSSWAPSCGMNDLVITFSEEPHVTIRIRVRRDDDLDEADIRTELKDRTLNIMVYNPHKMSHLGTPEPLSLGKLQGKRLLFSFRLDMFGNYHSYAVTYAFLLEEKV